MSPTTLQQQLITGLDHIPTDFPLVPLNGNKQPLGNDWQNYPFTPTQMHEGLERGWLCVRDKKGSLYKVYLPTEEDKKPNHNEIGGYGLITGYPHKRDGKTYYLMALDKDGASAGSKILELSGGQPLPHTVAFSSGRSGRCQYLFLVPEQYAKAIQTRKFRTGVTGDDGKGEQLELRWKGLQSVLPPSLHPTSGNYFYLEGCAIQECEIAIAPDWMIEAMLIEPTCSVSSAKPAASSTTAVPYQFGSVSPIVDPSILSIRHPEQISLPVPENFPLLLGCRKEVREWVASGVPKGSGRNDVAIKVGLELIAVERYLLSINQRFEDSAQQLFSEFCQRSGMTNKEDEERFRWCEAKHPTPSAGTKGVETCIQGWYWREFVKPLLAFASNKSVPHPNGNFHSSNNGNGGGDGKIINLASSDLLTTAELEREIGQLLAIDILPSKLEAIIPELARRSNRSEKAVWKLYLASENELSQAENLESNSGQFKKLIEYSNKTLDLFEVFPRFLATALLTKAKSDQIDPIHLVQNLLPAAGGILGGNIAIIAKQGVSDADHWREYPVIWTSNISEPSTGKTNAQNTIFKPLKRLQQEEDKRYKEAKKRLKQVEAAWQRKSAEEKQGLLDSRENPEVFKEQVVGTRRKWQYDIAQMEAVLRRLSEQDPNTGAIWVKDEQAGLFSGLDQYKGNNKGDSRQILLSMWGGQLFLEIERVDEDKSFQLSGQTLNMAGGLQPKIASKIFKNQEDSDGLLSRILPAVPQIPDGFTKWSDITVDLDTTIADLYTKLANLPKGVDCRLDPEAKQLWIKRWEALRRGFLYYVEENPAYAYFLGKQCSYVPRLALLLHCIEHCYKAKPDFEVISADTMQRAIALSDYYCGQFRLLQATAPQESAEVQLDGLMYKVFDKARKRGGKITTREAQQALRRDQVKAPALVGIFAAIVATGLATLSDSGKTLVLHKNQGVDHVDQLLIMDQQALSTENKEFQPFVDHVDPKTRLATEIFNSPPSNEMPPLLEKKPKTTSDQHDQLDPSPGNQTPIPPALDSVDQPDQQPDQQAINKPGENDPNPEPTPPGGGKPTNTHIQIDPSPPPDGVNAVTLTELKNTIGFAEKFVTLATTSAPEAEIDSSWLTPESLQDMADVLAICEDAETLADVCKYWPAQALNAAYQLLSPEQQAQINQLSQAQDDLAQTLIAENGLKADDCLCNPPLKVGDRVHWSKCPGHCESFSPFEITGIEGDYAKLDLFAKPVLLAQLRLAE
jgi:hypothetical protein